MLTRIPNNEPVLPTVSVVVPFRGYLTRSSIHNWLNQKKELQRRLQVPWAVLHPQPLLTLQSPMPLFTEQLFPSCVDAHTSIRLVPGRGTILRVTTAKIGRHYTEHVREQSTTAAAAAAGHGDGDDDDDDGVLVVAMTAVT